jgi:hypothetical protein
LVYNLRWGRRLVKICDFDIRKGQYVRRFHNHSHPLTLSLSLSQKSAVPITWDLQITITDGDEEDEEGEPKDLFIGIFLAKTISDVVKESPDQCFVGLEISVVPWIDSVAQDPEVLESED